jgi:hypothetical protein
VGCGELPNFQGPPHCSPGNNQFDSLPQGNVKNSRRQKRPFPKASLKKGRRSTASKTCHLEIHDRGHVTMMSGV